MQSDSNQQQKSAPQAPVTDAIARFVVNTRLDQVPAHVLSIARDEVLDGVAVMLAGTTEEATCIVREHVASLACTGAAAVVGSTLRTHAAAAALVNGTSAHAHDFDDTQIAASGGHVHGLLTHPTAPVWAATLAAAEQAGATGAETLLAYMIGIEVACRMCDASSSFHYVRGFHPTQSLTVFGAAAAASRLLGLTVPQVRCALGLAASMAAGLRINFGTMAKPLHAGRAAENGVLAAQLARRGLTARENALEDPGGFFKTFGSDLHPDDPALLRNPLWGYQEAGSPGFDAQRILGRLGEPWYFESPGLSIKPFPSVVLSHPSMVALQDILRSQQVAAGDIARIVVRAGPTVRLLMYRVPETGTQGKFSLMYCLAVIAVRGHATLADFTDELVRSDAMQRMMQRIELLPADDPAHSRGEVPWSEIEVVLHDGRSFRQEAGAYKGGPERPLSREERDEKFMQCASGVLGAERAAAALATVKRLPELERIGQLTEKLAA